MGRVRITTKETWALVRGRVGNQHGMLSLVIRYVPGTVVPAFVGLLSAMIFTRVLNTVQYGHYSLVLSITSLVPILCSMWLQQGLGRHLPGAPSETILELKSAAVGALLLIISATLCTSLLVGFGLPKFVGADWHGALLPGALLILATSLFGPLTTILQAELRAGRYTIYQISNVSLKFLLSLLLLSVYSQEWPSLIWAYAIGSLVLVPLAWKDANLPGLGTVVPMWRQSARHLATMANYGFPMIGWFLAAFLLSVGDRFVIQLVRGSAEVGIYSANSALVSRGVGLLTTPILLAAHPILMRSWSRGDRNEVTRILGRVIEWFGLTGLLLVGVFALFAQDIAQVMLGSNFRVGYLVMPIILASEVVWQMGMYTHKPLEFMGKTKMMLLMSLTMASLNVALNILLVPMFGYIIAAWTTLFCYLGYATVTAKVGKRYVQWSVSWTRLGLVGFLECCLVAVVALIRHYFLGRFSYGLELSVVVALALLLHGILIAWFVRPIVVDFLRIRASNL